MGTKQTIRPIAVYFFEVKKPNKLSTIYQLVSSDCGRNTFTDLVKLEVDQGFHRAMNLVYQLKLRTSSNWCKTRIFTGLRRTQTKGFYYGDIREPNKEKTLLLFRIDENTNSLTVWEFERFYYPSKQTIENLVKTL